MTFKNPNQLKDARLSPGQLTVLQSLSDEQPTTIPKLVSLLDMTNTTVTIHVRALVTKGLVTRSFDPMSTSKSYRPILSTTVKGSRAAKAGVVIEEDAPQIGITTPPRTFFSKENYVPAPYPVARPGANDHLNYKSRGF